MGLVDSIIGAGKTLLGYGLGFVLVFAGLFAGMQATINGSAITGAAAIIMIVLGAGLFMWAEQERRKTVRVPR